MRSLLAITLILASATAFADVDFRRGFAGRDACFTISDLETGKTVAEYGGKRCAERFSPCSTFKIAAALMAFDRGVLKDENQVVKWDGVHRDRSELNRDQTPFTWMSDSVKWVTEWIMPQLGAKEVQRYLDGFGYGNRDFSGGMKDAWVTSSLKISAHEQVAFLSKLWKGALPASGRAATLTRKIIFIKKLGRAELSGKTGTGCLIGHSCDHSETPGRMLGWFVGVLRSGSKTYVIAANASDLAPRDRPAGPRLRDTVIGILNEMGLTPD